jgi:alginate O-acetyltransferase complex protein AlgI
MTGLNEFLISPLFDHLLLTKGLALFTLFLLVIRFLPDFARNLTLLIASLVLIEITTSPLYTFLFVAATGLLYYLLFWIQWSPRKKFFCFVIAAVIVLFYFLLQSHPSFETVWTGSMVHRFGVAYSLFRLLSVTFDVARGRPLPADPLDFFVYAFFYPTFFMGPIERLDEFRENLSGRTSLSRRDTGSYLLRLGGALVKGWVVFHFLEIDWKQYFDYPQQHSYGYLIWGMYARSIGWYLIASAANDFTIGCSALAGYKISENYDYPYFRRNLAQFWRTFHMTLVRFMRDYLYIPLGGNRRHIYLNYLIVFMAIALWHVTGKAFVIWGLWHGIGMCVLRFWQNFWLRVEGREKGRLRSLQRWSRAHPRLMHFLGAVVTFHYVSLGWLPFFGGHPQGLSMILRIVSGNRWKLFEW